MSGGADELRADLAALHRRLEARGLFGRPARRVLVEWLFALALAVCGAVVAMSELGPALRALGLAASALGTIAMATIGHTASHGAFSGGRADALLYHFTYPFVLMVSARYWRHSHVHAHHAAPNVVGVDPDCDLSPYFSIHQGGGRRPSRLQGLAFALLLPLNGFHIQAQGYARLLHELRDPRRRELGAWIDLACLLAHVLVFVLLPMRFFPPLTVLGVYAARVTLIGVALFAILAPGHYPAEAACLPKTERHEGHFWARQTAATINFRAGRLGSFLCSGLQYQIEHHLFPQVSHVHLPALSEEVRALCEKHGLPHRTFGWGEAIWKSYRVFFEPKPVVPLAALGLAREGSATRRGGDGGMS